MSGHPLARFGAVISMAVRRSSRRHKTRIYKSLTDGACLRRPIASELVRCTQQITQGRKSPMIEHLMQHRERKATAESSKQSDARALLKASFLCACLTLCSVAWAEDVPASVPTSLLDRGYSGLYNLDFSGAQRDFAAWEGQHPDDAIGPVSQAAGVFFSEFHRLGGLESPFYAD